MTRKCWFCPRKAVIEYDGDIAICDDHDSAIKAAAIQEFVQYLNDMMEIEDIATFNDFKNKLKEIGSPYNQKYLSDGGEDKMPIPDEEMMRAALVQFDDALEDLILNMLDEIPFSEISDYWEGITLREHIERVLRR